MLTLFAIALTIFIGGLAMFVAVLSFGFFFKFALKLILLPLLVAAVMVKLAILVTAVVLSVALLVPIMAIGFVLGLPLLLIGAAVTAAVA